MVSLRVKQANVRAGPGTDYERLWKAWIYTPFEVLGTEGNWTELRDFLGDVGWVHSSLLAEDASVIVTAGAANVREGPGTGYDVVWEVDYGYPLKVIGQRGNWIEIRDEEDIGGWIHKSTVWGYPPPAESDPRVS